VNLEAAKTQLVWVLQQKVDSDDLAGFLHLDPDNFARTIHLVEDRDPVWLHAVLRDPRYPLGVRGEIAGHMRGHGVHRLLLDILG